MADSQKSVVSIVAILAIVILVGLVVYFIMQERDNTLEIDLGLATGQDAPVLVADVEGPGFTPPSLAGPGSPDRG